MCCSKKAKDGKFHLKGVKPTRNNSSASVGHRLSQPSAASTSTLRRAKLIFWRMHGEAESKTGAAVSGGFGFCPVRSRLIWHRGAGGKHSGRRTCPGLPGHHGHGPHASDIPSLGSLVGKMGTTTTPSLTWEGNWMTEIMTFYRLSTVPGPGQCTKNVSCRYNHFVVKRMRQRDQREVFRGY